MDKNKRNLTLLGGAILVVISIWIRGLTTPVGRKQPPIPVQASGTMGPQPKNLAIPSARTPFSDWGRNPFTLSEEVTEGVRGLVLEGIVWDEKIPLVVINDHVLKVGDTIRKSQITRITQKEVSLQDDEGHEFILKVGKGEPP